MNVEVDTELEQRLEAVLVRHGIPAELGNSDRGDLTSDLADAARKFQSERSE